MAGILGNTPTTSKSGGGILYKAKLERMKTEDTAEAARRSKMGTSKNITSETITSVKPKNLVQLAQGAQEAMYNAPALTPIDQRLNLFPNNEKADNRKYIGANLIPAYKEDSPLKKVGKGIVNYGVGGALSLVGNITGGLGQGMMQASRAGTNAILGKPQDFRQMTVRDDLLPKQYDKALTNLANKGTAGKIASTGIDMLVNAALDPTTFIGGGIVDDLSRGGIMGKASKPSTEMVRVLGDSQQKLLAKQAAKAAKQAGTMTDDVARQVDKVDDVQTQINKMDDYFQQKRADPLGGKLPKAEPKPIGGELPKGDIPNGMKERGFSQNIRTDAAMPDDIRKSFDTNPLTYDPLTNQETLAKAQTIMNQGEGAATAELYRSLGSKEFKPESVPLSKLIAQQALERGDVTTARQVLSETAEKLTEAGQFSQAAKILRESDPETFLMTIDKQIVKLNEQGLKQYGKKWANVDLLPDEITAIQGIQRGNQQAYEEVWEQIGSRIAKDLPSTGMEKFDAWRRMAMLLNPKTHIRNVGGNVIMMGMRKSSDTLGAGLEKLFGVKERTKSFGWSLNKNVASKVDETWDVVKKDILGESRWEIDNLKSLGREKNIFKNKALQGINEFSLKTLNAEDNIFAQRAFKDALGQFMQANKLDEATDAAIAYAKRRAMESTYKQANKLATWINQAKQIPGAGKLVEAAIPFSKTPANIMKTAFEYSPAGLTKLIFSKGKPAAEVIETLSKGLTGTAIAGLGFWLASMGAAKTQNSKSNKVSAIDAEMGEQAYSITTPQGSYTFDWAQPFAVPLAMGIAMYEGINNKDDLDFDAIMDSIAQGGDSFFNMSMLQNVKRFLGYGSTTENILGLPWNYVQQAWPSLFGQVAKTVDDTRRSTYDPNPTRQTLNQLKSRIPFASKSLEPSLNVWGEEQKQGGIIQQFVNPGYAKKASDDPVTKEVARLHGELGNNDMLPKMAQNFKVDGEYTKLSPQDMTQFQREMGQMNYREIKELINLPKYSAMTNEEKMKEIKKIVGDNYDEVKEGIIQRNGLKPSK